MSASTSPERTDVFISYHSGDREWVDALVADLKAQKITVWLDRERMPAGTTFAASLPQALQRARSLALVVSRGSLQSRWVQEECALALHLASEDGADFRIIPLLIDDAEAPGFLRNRIWIDFRDPTKRTESLAQLVAGIKGETNLDSTSGSAVEAWRDAPGRRPGIDEADAVARRIDRSNAAAARLRRARLLAPLPGLALALTPHFGLFAETPPPAVLASLLFSGPLLTALIGWAATASQLARREGEIERYAWLRDSLEVCRTRSGPECQAARKAFWEIVQSQTRQLHI